MATVYNTIDSGKLNISVGDTGVTYLNNSTDRWTIPYSNITFSNCNFTPQYESTAGTTDNPIFNSSNIVTSGTGFTTGSGGAYINNNSTDSIVTGSALSFYNSDTPYYTIGTGGAIHFGGNERDNKRAQLKHNLLISKRTREVNFKGIQENEQIAIETLREFITELEFRKYLKYGFVLVEGKSGNVYQVFRNDAHTKVWRGGKLLEEVCVRIQSDVKAPPTDNVIAFKQMIECDEQHFKTLGNVYKMAKAA